MKKRKKILVLAEVFYPEDFLINDLASEWIDKGYDLEILARAPSYPYGNAYEGYKNRLYQQDSYKGAVVHRIGFVKGYKNSVIKKILNYILFVIIGTAVMLKIGRRFDRLFIYHTGPLTLALPGTIAKKIYRMKVSIWTQDLWPDTVYAYGFKKTQLLHLFLTRLVRFVYKNCDHIFVTCSGFSKRIQEYVPGKEISTAPNWPIINSFEAPDEKVDIELPEGFNFTFTGNVGKVQNLENVIMGFGIFQKKNPDAYLNIVGDGSNLDNLKDLVQKESIGGVKFWGRYPVYTMPGFYAKSDVLVLSLIESPIYELTIPLKFQTYLTAGKPIFGIINGDVAKLIKNNHIGFTADPKSLVHISNAFENILQSLRKSDSELEIMAGNCKNLLESQFNRELIIENLTSSN
ncbi:glycosyltransferase family 4 protein [Rhodohalobacter sp. 8-1]|uniref:glycosyltransferase family 4 protein n=1 Tax=Rhodohalobacter sp. 8-1 TaxID=3131972 RepID=UPI0030ED432E